MQLGWVAVEKVENNENMKGVTFLIVYMGTNEHKDTCFRSTFLSQGPPDVLNIRFHPAQSVGAWVMSWGL